MSRIPYASIVGSLMYAILCTRLNISYKLIPIKFCKRTLDYDEASSQIFTKNKGLYTSIF